MVPPTRVVSISIWCISWGNHVGGCTHPWRIYIVPHGSMCLDFSPRVADSVVLPLGVPLGSN